MEPGDDDDGKLEPFGRMDGHYLHCIGLRFDRRLSFLLLFFHQAPEARHEIEQVHEALCLEGAGHDPKLVEIGKRLFPPYRPRQTAGDARPLHDTGEEFGDGDAGTDDEIFREDGRRVGERLDPAAGSSSCGQDIPQRPLLPPLNKLEQLHIRHCKERRTEDPRQRHIVPWREKEREVVHQVEDVLRLVEPYPAADLIRDAVPDERLLERLELVPFSQKECDIAERHRARPFLAVIDNLSFADEAEDAPGDQFRFAMLGIIRLPAGKEEFDPSRIVVGPRHHERVVRRHQPGEEPVDRRRDVRKRAEALPQGNDSALSRRLGDCRLRPFEDADIRIPEPVNGLLGVADNEEVSRGKAVEKREQNIELKSTGILVLIHHHVQEPAGKLVADSVVPQQPAHGKLEVVEVHPPVPGLLVFVTIRCRTGERKECAAGAKECPVGLLRKSARRKADEQLQRIVPSGNPFHLFMHLIAVSPPAVRRSAQRQSDCEEEIEKPGARRGPRLQLSPPGHCPKFLLCLSFPLPLRRLHNRRQVALQQGGIQLLLRRSRQCLTPERDDLIIRPVVHSLLSLQPLKQLPL